MVTAQHVNLTTYSQMVYAIHQYLNVTIGILLQCYVQNVSVDSFLEMDIVTELYKIVPSTHPLTLSVSNVSIITCLLIIYVSHAQTDTMLTIMANVAQIQSIVKYLINMVNVFNVYLDTQYWTMSAVNKLLIAKIILKTHKVKASVLNAILDIIWRIHILVWDYQMDVHKPTALVTVCNAMKAMQLMLMEYAIQSSPTVNLINSQLDFVYNVFKIIIWTLIKHVHQCYKTIASLLIL